MLTFHFSKLCDPLKKLLKKKKNNANADQERKTREHRNEHSGCPAEELLQVQHISMCPIQESLQLYLNKIPMHDNTLCSCYPHTYYYTVDFLQSSDTGLPSGAEYAEGVHCTYTHTYYSVISIHVSLNVALLSLLLP